jgi:tight adherence protein C
MEELSQLLASIQELVASFEVPGVDRQVLFLGIVLVTSVLFFITIGLLLIGRSSSPVKRKLEEYSQKNEVRSAKSKKLENTLESLSPVITPSSSKEKESVRHKLMHAGYHDTSALSAFYAIKTVTAVVGIGIAAAVWFYLPRTSYSELWVIIAVAVGMFAPNMYLERMIGKRVRRLRAGVPDALDLLVVCTESGLGFNAALQRVADELVISHPDFADELDTVCAKLKAGVMLSDAFNDLITRTGLEELRGLVSMLSHAAKIGGSLAQTLRDYTEDYRDKRQQEAEEIAAKIPTKMLFPMIIFIWPCFFIVAIGPGLMLVSEALK